MRQSRWESLTGRQPALFALILLVLSVVINLIVQPNMFARETLNSNMRVFLPIILMAVGQAIVILGGGIDISVGAIASIVNTVLATRVGLDGSPERHVDLCLSFLVDRSIGGRDQRIFYFIPALAAYHHYVCDKLFVCRFCALYSAESRRRNSG